MHDPGNKLWGSVTARQAFRERDGFQLRDISKGKEDVSLALVGFYTYFWKGILQKLSNGDAYRATEPGALASSDFIL